MPQGAAETAYTCGCCETPPGGRTRGLTRIRAGLGLRDPPEAFAQSSQELW
jgi:hypothetical protein